MVDIGAQTASGTDLHLMPLFTATLFSGQFKEAFGKNKFAAEVFYNNDLYTCDYNKSDDVHFLIKSVQKEMKYRNKWLSSIAEDINKIVDSESTTSDDGLVKGLLGALTEYWYFNENIPGDSAFIKFDGGVGLDPSKFNSKSDSKGINYFIDEVKRSINDSYSNFELRRYTKEKSLANLIDNCNAYIVGNYGDILTAVSVINNTFIWGNNSQSVIATGGDGNDVIVGTTDGISALSGGKGNYTLIGLAGSLINLGER